MENSVQIKGNIWRRAFSSFLKDKNIKPTSYYAGSTFPTDEWEHDKWYNDQLSFDKECGMQRDWLNDYAEGELYGYYVNNRKKFLVAKIKYGF